MNDSKHEGLKLASWLKRSPPTPTDVRDNLRAAPMSESKAQLNLKISESQFLEFEELRRRVPAGKRPLSKLELFRRMMANYRDHVPAETE